KIIPTTWSAGGAGIFGNIGEGINYRLYAVRSLQSIRPLGFSSGSGNGNGGQSGQFTGSEGIRDGRLQENKAIAEDFAATGRLEFTQLFPGLQLGFSFFTGETTQNIIDEGGLVLLLEADMKYRWQWFEMNASIANIDVEDAAAMNAHCTAMNAITAGTCSADVPDNIFGWNVQAGVHLPQLIGMDTTHDFIPFVLYEKIRPQDSMPSGTAPTHSNNFDVVTVGAAYYPIPEVALKTDFQHFMSRDGKSHDQFNMGLAFMY
ncbi:MAG: hypothetical protein GWM98_25665, partial [Nitrospinaceae bacterium]|nr:hypothetical protein [Nitrospinaceae bacterium]NIR57242.1 hypothetical protein [Nitrospinaceae bacterium]NIS87690.1 hypothetical protein [Nitrospinaceae bacterium]NIT84556.1 hypothetical protein [Nitrospinaceae bacterium]NIU46742.1 hypothetical protein [Nitrospinaceae bacterium]